MRFSEREDDAQMGSNASASLFEDPESDAEAIGVNGCAAAL